MRKGTFVVAFILALVAAAPAFAQDPNAEVGVTFGWSFSDGIKPWIGLAAGYNALRIDTGSVPKSGNAAVSELQYQVTQYGPVFSLTFHWASSRP